MEEQSEFSLDPASDSDSINNVQMSSAESSFSSDDNNACDSNLCRELAKWITEFNIGRNASDSLLAILKRNIVNNNIPLSTKTLLETPTEKLTLRAVEPGQYYHFGIQNFFSRCNLAVLKDVKEVHIDIGIDGLPLFRNSSQLKLWPILGALTDSNNIKPFLIGCYVGYAQPKSSLVYLSEFVEEITNLHINGLNVGKNIKKPFKIRLFSCDAPARSFLTEVMGHSSKNGCSKCTQVGHKPNNSSGVIFQTSVCEKRTDLSFKNRRDKSHHHQEYLDKPTALEVGNINMVSQFPIEPMHLLDLGITKKMLTLVVNGKSYGRRVNITVISQALISIKKFVPKEFQRLPRSLDDLRFWKATEFRQFLLYTGIVVLCKSVNTELYNHFLLLHCAVRMLSCPRTHKQNVGVAEKLLKKFVEDFGILYGNDKISFNVHNVLHICDCVRQFRHIDSFSAYKFENAMQGLRRKFAGQLKYYSN